MQGDYKPGDRLVETQIAKDLNVSQAPVREALRDLEQMGIVVTEAYKGTYVREISKKDLISYYDVRAELEGLAMRLAMPHLTEKDIKQMEQCMEKMEAAAASGDHKLLVNSDIAFHEIIINASDNISLQRCWQNIKGWTYFGTLRFSANKLMIVHTHSPILDAVKTGNPIEASERMREHFLGMKEQLP